MGRVERAAYMREWAENMADMKAKGRGRGRWSYRGEAA